MVDGFSQGGLEARPINKCFAFELYYRVFFFDNVTIHLRRISSKSCRKPLHCLDLGAQECVHFEQFPCLQVKLVLGHVSFPEKIAERRMCGFLFHKNVFPITRLFLALEET